jgi:hypothetical protein
MQEKNKQLLSEIKSLKENIFLKDITEIDDVDELCSLMQACSLRKFDARKRLNEIDPILCVVCLEAQRNVGLKPCLHFCLCSACAPKVEICPICRKEIEQRVEWFTS